MTRCDSFVNTSFATSLKVKELSSSHFKSNNSHFFSNMFLIGSPHLFGKEAAESSVQHKHVLWVPTVTIPRSSVPLPPTPSENLRYVYTYRQYLVSYVYLNGTGFLTDRSRYCIQCDIEYRLLKNFQSNFFWRNTRNRYRSTYLFLILII